MASLDEIRAERLRKVARLREQGMEPYPVSTQIDHSVAQVKENFAGLLKAGESVTIAGRVRAVRGQGAIAFFDMSDGAATLQAMIKRGEGEGDKLGQFIELVDIGDFIEITGTLFVTKKKEETIEVSEWQMLAKSLRPLPDKWHGLQDVEERFRRRYLDTLMSPEVRERFVVRSRVVSFLRGLLDEAGFIEIETPVLQPLPGGASAAPFVTHHNALDTDLYLRVSDELYLKRLLVAGFPKVYEIARDFRNEGIDVTHNPEFTMLEWYEAYSDAAKQRAFVSKLIKALVKHACGKTSFVWNGETINVGPAFKTVKYLDLIKSHTLITDPANATREDMALKANQLGVSVEPSDGKEKILDSIYKKICRPKLIQPTFLIDYPADYLPLAKRKPDNPDLVDAFQLVIGGVEIVKAFSELNDPVDQRERFETQEKQREAGDTEAQRIDEDFLEALEYGMPPAGGVGIGVDRLVMLLTNTQNIKEVIFFPTMRPR